MTVLRTFPEDSWSRKLASDQLQFGDPGLLQLPGHQRLHHCRGFRVDLTGDISIPDRELMDAVVIEGTGWPQGILANQRKSIPWPANLRESESTPRLLVANKNTGPAV